MSKYDIENLIKTSKGSIVDVRTSSEFAGGHVLDSINIPLTELPSNIDQLKALEQPIILCCASGGRSAQAEKYLHLFGIECVDAGSWMNLNFYKNSFA